MTKIVLVTGGAGFLGSHVCDRLLSEGKKVICVDNLSTGNIRNIRHNLESPNFQFMNENVTEMQVPFYVDEVWNLASPASPPKYMIDPLETMMTNVIGTQRALEIAERYGARFFQASTSEVYGDPEVHPQTEYYKGSVNTYGPRACYDEGKRAAETLCYIYQKEYGVDVRIVRIFNTYGLRMDMNDGRVITNFIINALQNKPLELYGDGKQTRSFCYYSDLIDGMFKLMRRDDPIYHPVNIGNPIEFTVRELAELVVKLTSSKSEFINLPLPKDDPSQRCPDISTMEKEFFWRPKVGLEQGLLNTISYLKES